MNKYHKVIGSIQLEKERLQRIFHLNQFKDGAHYDQLSNRLSSIEEVKERVGELISILQEPDDYNSRETIELVEEELSNLERDNPEIFQS